MPKPQVVIAIAGMEGALASVVGGLAELSGHRRSHQRGLRRELWWRSRAARHAQLLRQRRHRSSTSTTALVPPTRQVLSIT